MKHLIMWGLCLAMGAAPQVKAQQWKSADSIQLPFADKHVFVHWVNLDNDTLPDVFIGYPYQPSQSGLFRNTGTGWSWQALPISGLDSAVFSFTDINRDSRMDVAVMGQKAGVPSYAWLINQGNLTFQTQPLQLPVPDIRSVGVLDMDNSGTDTWLIAGNTHLYAGQFHGSAFQILWDTSFVASQLVVHDLDRNGFPDMVLTGRSAAGPATWVRWLKSNLEAIRTEKLLAAEAVISGGDLDHDGLFDLLICSGQSGHRRVFINDSLAFHTIPGNFQLDSAHTDILDVDMDGKADQILAGVRNGAHLSWIQTATGDSLSLPAEHVLFQSLTDYDNDGDPDLLQLVDGSMLRFVTNDIAAPNMGPASPDYVVGVPVLNRTFLYWNQSVDDHTPSGSITYDVRALSGDQVVYNSNFDQESNARLLPLHGSRTTDNFLLMKGVISQFVIQGIDNARIASSVSGGGGGNCGQVAQQQIFTCKDMPVQLSSTDKGVMWFSFSRGFLGSAATKIVDATDTVFSFVPGTATACAQVKLYTVTVMPEDTVHTQDQMTICKGKSIQLTVADEWQQVTWTNDLTNQILQGNSVSVQPGSNAIYTATGTNVQGCVLDADFQVALSEPVLQLNGDHFQIAPGGSVQLVASGALSYSWTPPTSLSQADIPNPVSTPVNNMTYTVTGLDSIGCAVSATVRIDILLDAFVTTLFTPNGDGKNDELKIFGLNNPTGFRFEVFNREGVVVYASTDASQVMTTGWDGTTNGSPQPPGTYYWKIAGENTQGGSLTLNGRRNGSVLLVR
ncbi:MAG: gliding motility-associated C-terminal domain-containing protein [Cyclobacteriaceae bacterium]